jgi:A/G-specific adenine glycosylase
MAVPLSFVMPAKAGIQCGESSPRYFFKSWIPAFAGMTTSPFLRKNIKMATRTTISAALPQMKPRQLRTFHAALARWYQTHGRHDLPWRTTDDPYHIWLSEVMLQQTQVATVRDRFYAPFLAKFPSVAALAAAPEAAVMKAWEGLGYYSRARNLHKAAKQVSGARCQVPALLTKTWNARPETLLSLPGIGRNTASAILAFAYHQPVAILEANVKRIIARVFALTQPNDAELWAGAEALLNRDEPFNYNQAMMDIGALICTPKNPNCNACPASSICKGKIAPEKYPTPKTKKANTHTRSHYPYARGCARAIIP